MRCKNCSQSFRVVTGGMGSSGPPGTYFRVGVVFAFICLTLFLLEVSIWPWVFMLFAAMMLGWSWTAVSECYNPDCPHCKFENDRKIIRPWSL